MSENIIDTEIEKVSAEDPLNMLRTTSNVTTFVSEIPNIVNEENITVATW